MSEIFLDGVNIVVDIGPIFTDKVSMFWCDKKVVSIQSITKYNTKLNQYTAIYLYIPSGCTCNSCYTGTGGLPDICTPEARGLQARGLRPRVPALQPLCNTSFSCKWLHYIYSSTYCFQLWIQIMTHLLLF